jgi:rRNA maturation endonuclease Nob1
MTTILLSLILLLLVLVVFGHMTKSVLREGLSYKRRCPHCRTTISGNATHCPNCTRPTGFVKPRPTLPAGVKAPSAWW